jgi:hypothetical protein
MGEGENKHKHTKCTHVFDPVPRADPPLKIILILPQRAEVPPHQLCVSPHHEAPLPISSSSNGQGGEQMQTHQTHSCSQSRTARGPPPQKLSSSSHSGLRCHLTNHPRHEAHLPKEAPGAASPRECCHHPRRRRRHRCLLHRRCLAAAAAATNLGAVPRRGHPRRVTHVWLVAISLPPPTMEDCPPTNHKIGASLIQLIHLFRKWYRLNDCCWREKVHSCDGRLLLLL